MEVMECEPMAKAKPKKLPNDDRVTLLNLKGSPEEKAVLDDAIAETGVSLSVMTRRGLAMWLKSRNLTPPASWVGK
jgi:hypothetical protein